MKRREAELARCVHASVRSCVHTGHKPQGVSVRPLAAGATL